MLQETTNPSDSSVWTEFRLQEEVFRRSRLPLILMPTGIVNVSAKDLGTGKEQHITITAGSNMSDDDIDKAVREAAEYEAQDKKRKEAVDTKNDADAMVFQTEKALEEAGDKLDANDKTAVEADLNALKELLNSCANTDEITDAQVADIKAGKDKLMESAQKLFAKMYEQAQASQGTQAGRPDAGTQGGMKHTVMMWLTETTEKYKIALSVMTWMHGVFTALHA